jgi:DNA-damage-inducible protein D
VDDLTMSLARNRFDSVKNVDNEGVEFWSARDLMPMLGYERWENFLSVIERAKQSVTSSAGVIHNHFRSTTKMVSLGSGGQRNIADVHMTRHGAYLVAMNGSTQIPSIAAAQRYFLEQARRQEIRDDQVPEVPPREVEDKRLRARNKLRDTEAKVERSVYGRGIHTPQEFARFKNNHITALYGGLNTNQLKKLRGIPQTRALADFDHEVELSAKEFALSMTNYNIGEKDLQGGIPLNNEVVANSKVTRKALLNRGISPEKLSAAEDLKKIQRRRDHEALDATQRMAKLDEGGSDRNAGSN